MIANEWATYTVYLAFAIGLFVCGMSLTTVVLGRHQSFLQPDVNCVLFLWTGYHLSPLIAVASGKHWEAFMLFTEYIENGLWISLLSMIMFVVGFRILDTQSDRARLAWQSWAERRREILAQGDHVKKIYVWIPTVIVFVLFVISVGGFQEVWEASYSRGDSNWVEQTLEVRIKRFLSVVMTLMMLATVSITAIMSVSSERSILKNATVIGALLVASLSSLHGFSRGAGIAFFTLGVIRLALMGKRDWRVFAGCILFGVWLGYVGYAFRGEYRPGIGTYIEAAYRSVTEPPQVKVTKDKDDWVTPESNLLSSINAYTAVVALVESQRLRPFEDVFEFLFNLHPFPSGLIRLQERGADLTDFFRTRGQVGLTTPTLGDLYVTFGFATPLVFFALGLLYSFMAKQAKRYGATVESVMLLLLFVSWPISLHSGFRSQWRLINVALICLFFLHVMQRRGYFKQSNSHRPNITRPPIPMRSLRIR